MEAALGTDRVLVLPGGSIDRPNKLDFDIPAGIEGGTVMEVSRGWDRAKVRITVVQDPRFIVEGNDIHLRIPITLKEALDGAEITVPGVDQVHTVRLRSGADATNIVCVPEAGIDSDDEPGDLYVKPVIVTPTQVTETLRAAVQVVEKHSSGSPRAEFTKDPSDERFLRDDPDKLSVYLPISFSEAIEGTELEIPVLGNRLRVAIEAPWDFAKDLILTDLQQETGKLVYVYPEVEAPQQSSGDLQGAALAIEQHQLKHPRAHLPRILRQAKQ